MSAANRERKIVAAIACPQCGAEVGRPCSLRDGRPFVCRERREAWQAWRESRPPDLEIEPIAGAIIIRAMTPEARAWLHVTPYGMWTGEYLMVKPEQLVSLTLAATEAGFKAQ